MKYFSPHSLSAMSLAPSQLNPARPIRQPATVLFPTSNLRHFDSIKKLELAQLFCNYKAYYKDNLKRSFVDAHLRSEFALISYRATLELASFKYLGNGSYYQAVPLGVRNMTEYYYDDPAGQVFVSTMQNAWVVLKRSLNLLEESRKKSSLSEVTTRVYLHRSEINSPVHSFAELLLPEYESSRRKIPLTPATAHNPDKSNTAIFNTSVMEPQVMRIRSAERMRELQVRRVKELAFHRLQRCSVLVHSSYVCSNHTYLDELERLSYYAHSQEGEKGAYCPKENGEINIGLFGKDDMTWTGRLVWQDILKARMDQRLNDKMRDGLLQSDIRIWLSKTPALASMFSYSESLAELHAESAAVQSMKKRYLLRIVAIAHEENDLPENSTSQAWDRFESDRLLAMLVYEDALVACYGPWPSYGIDEETTMNLSHMSWSEFEHAAKYRACERFYSTICSQPPCDDEQPEIFVQLLRSFEYDYHEIMIHYSKCAPPKWH